MQCSHTNASPAFPACRLSGWRSALAALCCVALIGVGAEAQVSHWDADGDALDSIGPNHGTMLGDTTFGVGLSGQAFQFDGSGDYVTLGSGLQMGTTQDFSLSLWLNTTSPTSGSLLSNRHSTNGQYIGYSLQITSAGLAQVTLRVSSTSTQNVVGTTPLNDGQWHHVAATADRDGLVNLYVDCELEASTPAIVGNVDSPNPLNIGWNGAGSMAVNFFTGSIDEVSVFTHLLSAAELDGLCHGVCQQDLGFGSGAMELAVCGQALDLDGSQATLSLTGATASTPVFFVVGIVNNPTPLLGGTLVPFPFLVLFDVPSSVTGTVEIPVPGGANSVGSLFVQAVLPNGAASEFSNALEVVIGL